MTREEAVKILKSGEIVATTCDMKDYTKAREMAIKALEQEPILDNIDVLQIIDKYKVEREGKE